MSVRETALVFGCAGEPLIGVLSQPQHKPRHTGVVLVVGGPQYRSGSHRQFVLLARALAEADYAVLRFDSRGMGDSSGNAPGFETLDADIGAAIDALQAQQPAIQRVVLWGLCDGASAALMYAQRQRDPRVAGFALANPWLHTEQAEAHARVHRYYRQRFFESGFWRKALCGQVNPLRKLHELAGQWLRSRNKAGPAGHAQLMLAALATLRQPMLLLLCRRDATAQAFRAQLELENSALLALQHVRHVEFAEADHTFSCAAWRKDAENVTIRWINESFPD